MKKLIFFMALIVAFATSSFAYVNIDWNGCGDISTGYAQDGSSASQGYTHISGRTFHDLHVDLHQSNTYCVASGGASFYTNQGGLYLGGGSYKMPGNYDGDWYPASIVAPANTGYAVVFASTFIDTNAPSGTHLYASSTIYVGYPL